MPFFDSWEPLQERGRSATHRRPLTLALLVAFGFTNTRAASDELHLDHPAVIDEAWLVADGENWSASRGVLQGREGEVFDAVVTDEDARGARIQLCDPPVVARVVARRVDPGDDVQVKLIRADAAGRTVAFERVG